MNSLTELISDTIAHAEQYQSSCDGDYIKDGLLYCGKCNTPKQCEITIGGIKRTVYCLCNCGKVEQERLEAEFKANKRNADIRQKRDVGIQDSKLLDCTFENNDSMDAGCSKKALAYCDKFEEFKKANIGLYIHGTPGTGKTFIAGCIANKMIDKGVSVLATSFSRLIKQIWSSENKNATISEIVSYPLLIIDDFGVEANSQYNQENIYTIIDERYKSSKPIIITSNIPYALLAKPANMQQARIYSRIIEMCQPIEIQGGRRLKASVEKSKLFNDILEGA